MFISLNIVHNYIGDHKTGQIHHHTDTQMHIHPHMNGTGDRKCNEKDLKLYCGASVVHKCT